MLQVGIGRKSESLAGLALGIEVDQFAGYVLDFLLGLVLLHGPGVAADAVQAGRNAFLAGVAGHLVQAVDAEAEHVVVLIDQADGFLFPAVDHDFLQAGETPDAVIHVHDIVARLEAVEFLDGQCLAVLAPGLHAETVVPLENLVVGEAGHFHVLVHEAFVE